MLTYHFDHYPVQLAASRNGIHAVRGVTFVSDVPEHRAVQWRDLLDPDAALTGDDDDVGCMLGSHALRWLTPERFGDPYDQPWRPASHPQGEIAVVQVVADQLETVEQAAAGTEMTCVRLRRADHHGPIALLRSDPTGGFLFAVHQEPRARWLAEHGVSLDEPTGISTVTRRLTGSR